MFPVRGTRAGKCKAERLLPENIGGRTVKISLICFTERGFQTEKRIVKILKDRGYSVCPYVMGKYAMQAASMDHEISFAPVKEGTLVLWAGERFTDSEAIGFIGACGIAVRAIAPHIRDKRTDPAVVVLDEAARFVVPLLSGHLGGANCLAEILAENLEARAVITTATDVNHRFAVDVFAKEHGLIIDNMTLAKEVSADILSGEPVGLFCDFPVDGPVPGGLFMDTLGQRNLWITIWKKERGLPPQKRMLRLIPRCVAVGVGCRRGTEKRKLYEEIQKTLEENRIDMRAVCALSSIDLKSSEAGITELSGELGIPFLTYSKEELERVDGSFTESEFVKRTTGVGNVCERAAMAACLETSKTARLLVKKHAGDGVTVAAACFLPELFASKEESL